MIKKILALDFAILVHKKNHLLIFWSLFFVFFAFLTFNKNNNYELFFRKKEIEEKKISLIGMFFAKCTIKTTTKINHVIKKVAKVVFK